jgi:hypothetical protein
MFTHFKERVVKKGKIICALNFQVICGLNIKRLLDGTSYYMNEFDGSNEFIKSNLFHNHNIFD